MQESQDPARTAAALCPWLPMSLEAAAAPAVMGERLETLLETPALVGVAAKGGANAPPQAGFPPWSISFQLADPTVVLLFGATCPNRSFSRVCFLEEMPHVPSDQWHNSHFSPNS